MIRGALAALCAALIGLLSLWGFSVDDAWIIARVAEHLRETGASVWNTGGPVTDAVTPWGFERVVVAFGSLGFSSTFEAARWLGVIAFLGTSCALGARLARSSARFESWLVLLSGLALGVPAAAWAGAGLETPVVGALVLTGAWSAESRDGRRFFGAFALGCAAAGRPELTPVLAVVLFALTRWRPAALSSRISIGAIFATPLVAVALARWLRFDSLVPLSAIAKAPSFAFGLRSALGGLFLAGAPALLLGTTLGRLRSSATTEHVDSNEPSEARTLSLARLGLVTLGVHVLAVLFAGGDWMPCFRLFVPMIPWWLWIAAATARRRWFTWIGVALSLVGPASYLIQFGADSRSVIERRLSWIERARPLLASSRVVATVDIGWVGAAFPGTIVDLAGVTDPRIAHLPGGHTSKNVSPGLFAQRDVDTWIVRARGGDCVPPESLLEIFPVYFVDERLLRGAADFGFEQVGCFALEGTSDRYVVLRSATGVLGPGPSARE